MFNKSAETKLLAKKIRMHALQMTNKANASHVGSCLSMADLLSVLYAKVLHIDVDNDKWEGRDRFILSKGHGAAILYAALAERGFFDISLLNTYYQNGTLLGGHPIKGLPGIEISTGSLGHGLSVGCGMAIAGKREKKAFRVFVLMSDGELNEGSVWEAALFAQHHHLDNLIAIIDHNNLQGFGKNSDVLTLSPLKCKWEAFNWAGLEIDGHNHEQIYSALSTTPFESNRPNFIIANTIKGKGVSFMENLLAWHYQAPNSEQLICALNELEDDEKSVS